MCYCLTSLYFLVEVCLTLVILLRTVEVASTTQLGYVGIKKRGLSQAWPLPTMLIPVRHVNGITTAA